MQLSVHLLRLNVLDLIKSPTAAAVAYSLTNPSRGKRNVLVCDMGGSYFDFSLLTLEDLLPVELSAHDFY